jgi:hypothetical protein
MAFAWRTTDEFCSIWSAAKPRTGRTITAIGDYPSDRRRPFETSKPVLANVLKAKARRNETPLLILSSALAPQAAPKPTVELLPSTEARFPRSLTHWNPIQNEGESWPKPDTSAIWNVVVQRAVRTNFPEHELRGLKPRVWRRALSAPKLTGLQSAAKRIITLDFQRPDGPGDLNELMQPNWREVQIQDSAEAPRIQAANLARTAAVKRWSPSDTARSSVVPLRLLAPSFAISVPDPKPLR